MSYQGRRRAPRKRLIDRIRDWWYGGEEQVLTDDHGNPIGGDLPPVWQTQKVGGVHVPLYGEPAPPRENPWVNCAFAKDVPRPGGNGNPSGTVHTGPGYLSAFASPFAAPGHIPTTLPALPAAVTLTRPRVPRYILAGA